MAASSTDKLRKGTNNFSTTLSGAIGTGDTTISLASTTNLPTDTAIDLVIDRVDSSGNLTPSAREYIKGIVSGTNIISVSRGQGNSTALAHSSGAVVESVFTSEAWNDHIDAHLQDHSELGYHNTLHDVNGNIWLAQSATSSAVNYATLTNAATGGNPSTTATGSDTNIDYAIGGKGTGSGRWMGYHDGWILANETPTFASSTTINVSSGSKFQIGDLIQFTQSSTAKYFVVAGISSNVLTLTGLGGATVANSAISNFFYSRERIPTGLGLNGGIPYNPYKFSVYLNSALSLSAGTWTKIGFDTKEYDTGSNYDAVTNKRFNAPIAGFYVFSAGFSVNISAAGDLYGIAIYKNGVEVKRGSEASAGLSFESCTVTTPPLQLAANDYVEVYGFNSTGAGKSLNTGSALTYFGGFLVSAT